MEVASVCGNHHLLLGATLQQPNNLEPTILSAKFIHYKARIFTPKSRHHNVHAISQHVHRKNNMLTSELPKENTFIQQKLPNHDSTLLHIG